MDPLADVLDLCRVSGGLLASVTARAPWGLALPQSPGASLHGVTAGTAWLQVEGHAPLQLMPGDVLLLPSGTPHRLSSSLDAACRPWDRSLKEELMTPDGELHLGETGATTTFVCAGYDYDPDLADPLLSVVPEVLHVPAGPIGSSPLTALLALLGGEVGGGARREPGARASIARLIDLLLITTVRGWVARDEVPAGTWAAALRDPSIGRAVALIHDRPGQSWTVEALAAEVHLSRATFARRFTALTGQPPLSYLTSWRMALAARRLKDTDAPIHAIADDLGYRSEFAFNRAFRRHRGQPPGRYRAAAAAVGAGA